eukprot:g4510.t1
MLVGDVVNTAARLMSAGKSLRQESIEPAASGSAEAETSFASGTKGEKDGGGSTPTRFSSGVIVVDRVTAGLAGDLVQFEKLGRITLKGKTVRVEVYTPLGPAVASCSHTGFEMIGQTEIKATLLERASSLMQGFEGGLLVLQGEPGVGKTLLVEECGREWRREGVQTLGLNHSYARVNNGTPFSAWKGVMHSILLLYRSIILVAATPDASAGSGGGGGGGGGGETSLDFVSQATEFIEHTLDMGGIRSHRTKNTDSDSAESISPNPLQAQGSVSDMVWGAAQARADAHATTAAPKSGIGTASEVGLANDGDAEGKKKLTLELTDDQSQIAQEIAEQLDTETRVLRSMFSAHEAEGFEFRKADVDSGGHRQSSHEASCSREAADRPPTGKQDRQAETNGDEQHSCRPLDPWGDDDTQHHHATPHEPSPLGALPSRDERRQPMGGFPSTSPLSPSACCDSEREINDTNRMMPWWAGAFGAVSEKRDSPAARGFYARRFCEIFFPDNAAAATEVLCTLLDGDLPSESPAFPRRSANFETTTTEARVEQEQDGDETKGNGSQEKTKPGSAPATVTERRREGNTLGVVRDGGVGGSRLLNSDDSAGEEQRTQDEKPEKSRFNVLLGMLTIATVVDAEGKAASSWAAKSSSGMGPEWHHTGTTSAADEVVHELLDEDLEVEAAKNGGSNSSVGGGVRGVVAVLDDGQEMDRFSCDLVKGEAANESGAHVDGTGEDIHNGSGGGGCGGNHVDGTGEDIHNSSGGGGCGGSSSSSSSSSSESGAYWSDDDPDRKGGSSKSSQPETIDWKSGPAGDAVRPSPPGADDDDADRLASTVGGTVTSSANLRESPEEGPSDNADCIGDRPTREVPTEVTPILNESSTTEALQPNSDDGNDGNPEEAARARKKPAAATFLTVECEQSTRVGGDNGAGVVTMEPREEKTNQEVRMAETTGEDGIDILPQACAERLSGSGIGETSGGGRGTAGDNSINMTDTQSRAEIGRNKSLSKVSRKTSKRSVSTVMLNHRSGGGGGGVVEPPPNTPHLQIGAAAFLEAGNVGPKRSVTNIIDHGRRDSGFVRYWNPGTIKLLDILFSLQHKTTVETVRVRSLRYEEAVKLACRQVDCDMLDPLVGVALYLRTNGNPLSIIGYCSLMVERNLGYTTSTANIGSTTKIGSTTATSPGHIATPSPAGPNFATEGLQAEAEGTARARERDGGRHRLATDDAEDDEVSQRATANQQRQAHPTTVFRFQDSMNVFKVLEGTVPSSVESRIVSFLGCLSAQQSFILRVMSVIGTQGIEAELLEVVYKRLSHNHRKELHGHIADWLLERQRQRAKSEERVASEIGDSTSARRRGSFDGGQAAAMGHATAPIQRTPMIVHHLTLAHNEQKAMIRAHLFGVKELEAWAMGAFAVILEKHAVGVPEDLLCLARECKEFMWLCPSLIGILKTLLAIRSGAGVSNATTKFRHRMRSSDEALPLCAAADILPATTEEDEEESEAVLERSMSSLAARDAAEERPECVNEETSSTTKLHSRQDGPEAIKHVDCKGVESTGGMSKVCSFGVISGPFTNRQGSFRDRHVRPRTADGSTSPTRSAALIYVTTRSNFDMSGHQSKCASLSLSSRGGDRTKWHTKSPIPRRHQHGSVQSPGDDRGGWEGDNTAGIPNEASSGQHPESPTQQQQQQRRPKTAVPLESTQAPSHGAGEGPRTWFPDARATRSARVQHMQALRGDNSATRSNFVNGYQKNALPIRARTAAARRAGHTAPDSFGLEDLILSPERAAVRLASIRKAYGRENAFSFRGRSLQATTLKSSSSASLAVRRRGRK